VTDAEYVPKLGVGEVLLLVAVLRSKLCLQQQGWLRRVIAARRQMVTSGYLGSPQPAALASADLFGMASLIIEIASIA